ncbi:MAG: cytochrome C, partial [Betaproteobacteria bacterium]
MLTTSRRFPCDRTRVSSMLNRFAASSLAALLAACGPAAPPDRYDQSKMDLKPTLSSATNERHTGAFSAGTSLSIAPEIKPLDPSPVKTIQLDTTHKVIEIAPGVKFSAWTFGDHVPGPVIRARVGDRI